MTEIFIVEDEPTLSDAYQFILNGLYNQKKIGPFKSIVFHNYIDTVQAIDDFFKSGKTVDLCILDFRLAQSIIKENENGLTLGLILQKYFPKCKIILITSITEKYIFHTIINELRPSGFFIKSETSFDSLEKDISAVLDGKMVYSNTINEFIKKGTSKDTGLDGKDLKVLHLLSKNKSLLEIARIMNLSLSGIEYRKRRIAQKIGAPTSNVQDILTIAKQELNLL
ncbi:MAG: hypothetical protein AAF600_02695 [Bacteroidota bacterium]